MGEDRYVVKRSLADQQWYFHRQASNGEIVATSEGYIDKDSAEQEAHREADPEGMTVIVEDEEA